ncbi:hypothetical protein LMG18102_01996 [Ralstonia mannitolilytica]|uniref:DUF3304 domain-containing protein n=1 Tax=Ralstonia mannitolilytica TaxID=105219 RepID=UPI0028F65D6E|nr:DUF3304 domain-containing protein [Ralstonia mannitolilytica]CAJ0694719.1 hypothetical protein LMG18102_01996 [Ralstonia mannitolilytica]
MRTLKNYTPQLRTAMQWLTPFLVMGLIVSCLDNKATVEVTGYNHMKDQSIAGFSVNGAGGPNIGPQSGGGKFNCCIEIPKRWHRGMKAKVEWSYGYGIEGPGSQPPPQEAVVDIPEYTSENLGTLQVHFYDNHRVKVVVSKWALGNAEYPLPKEDWAPWTINERWERSIREIREEGGDV